MCSMQYIATAQYITTWKQKSFPFRNGNISISKSFRRRNKFPSCNRTRIPFWERNPVAKRKIYLSAVRLVDSHYSFPFFYKKKNSPLASCYHRQILVIVVVMEPHKQNIAWQTSDARSILIRDLETGVLQLDATKCSVDEAIQKQATVPFLHLPCKQQQRAARKDRLEKERTGQKVFEMSPAKLMLRCEKRVNSNWNNKRAQTQIRIAKSNNNKRSDEFFFLNIYPTFIHQRSDGHSPSDTKQKLHQRQKAALPRWNIS